MSSVENSLNPDKQTEIHAAKNETLTNFTLSVLSSLESGLSSVDKNPILAFRAVTPIPSREILSPILGFDIEEPKIENNNLKRRRVEYFLTEGMIETVTAILTKAAQRPYQMLSEKEGNIFKLLTTAKTADGKMLTPEIIRTTLRNHFLNRDLRNREEVIAKSTATVFEYKCRKRS